MAYSESLAKRLRTALGHITDLEEKPMFGSLAFMVNGKMCLTAGPNRIMCCVDPKLHDELVTRKGCQAMEMKGRTYKGYIHVNEEVLETEEALQFWVELALDQNKRVK